MNMTLQRTLGLLRHFNCILRHESLNSIRILKEEAIKLYVEIKNTLMGIRVEALQSFNECVILN